MRDWSRGKNGSFINTVRLWIDSQMENRKKNVCAVVPLIRRLFVHADLSRQWHGHRNRYCHLRRHCYLLHNEPSSRTTGTTVLPSTNYYYVIILWASLETKGEAKRRRERKIEANTMPSMAYMLWLFCWKREHILENNASMPQQQQHQPILCINKNSIFLTHMFRTFSHVFNHLGYRAYLHILEFHHSRRKRNMVAKPWLLLSLVGRA